eukprot:PLAT14004.2.p1 GENE.PLAT14004.2~~PLAT14004.2.p1  ORF type:complete len:852 (+),score=324.25 PLAT14004.2:327-2558(+)
MRWFTQLACALNYIHSRRILHRDLKTQNIFLTSSGVIKLGDFGISKVLSSTASMASTMIGTPYYMSPELCEDAPYNNKSDMWALGCVLYELTTLTRAFEGRNIGALVLKIISGRYPPIPDRYSTHLAQLVDALLQKDPAERPDAVDLLRIPFVSEHLDDLVEDVTDEADELMRDAGVPEVSPGGGGGGGSGSGGSADWTEAEAGEEGSDDDDSRESAVMERFRKRKEDIARWKRERGRGEGARSRSPAAVAAAAAGASPASHGSRSPGKRRGRRGSRGVVVTELSPSSSASSSSSSSSISSASASPPPSSRLQRRRAAKRAAEEERAREAEREQEKKRQFRRRRAERRKELEAKQARVREHQRRLRSVRSRVDLTRAKSAATASSDGERPPALRKERSEGSKPHFVVHRVEAEGRADGRSGGGRRARSRSRDAERGDARDSRPTRSRSRSGDKGDRRRPAGAARRSPSPAEGKRAPSPQPSSSRRQSLSALKRQRKRDLAKKRKAGELPLVEMFVPDLSSSKEDDAPAAPAPPGTDWSYELYTPEGKVDAAELEAELEADKAEKREKKKKAAASAAAGSGGRFQVKALSAAEAESLLADSGDGDGAAVGGLPASAAHDALNNAMEKLRLADEVHAWRLSAADSPLAAAHSGKEAEPEVAGGGRAGGSGALAHRVEELRQECEEMFGERAFLRIYNAMREAEERDADSGEDAALSARLHDLAGDRQDGLVLVMQLLHCENRMFG